MKMMMKMVLVLVGVLAVSACDLHEDLAFSGCSDTDGEEMYALDNELLWYADFEKREGVNAQPVFVDPVAFPDGFVKAQVNQQICKNNLEILSKILKDQKPKRDPPSTPIVYPRDEVELAVKNSLVCLVTGFFPAPVKIYWEKNGKTVTEGISTNVPLPNNEGLFSQISRLEFIPQQGDIYSCSVSHITLDQPLTTIYEVKLSVQGVGPAIFYGLCLTVGLLGGLLGAAAGTIFLIKGNVCS